MTRLLQSLEDLKIKESDLEYLKIKEVVSQLQAEGYSVTEYSTDIDNGFDIVATKDGKKLAVEVKTSSRLQASAENIKNLRKLALEQGFDEFRLILVNPPREVKVSIEKLEQELFEYMTQNLATILHDLSLLVAIPESSVIKLTGISDISIHSVNVAVDGVRVVGDGVSEIVFEYLETERGPFWSAGFPPQDRKVPMRWRTDLPFTFDVSLDHDLRISKIQKVEIDTSSFND